MQQRRYKLRAMLVELPTRALPPFHSCEIALISRDRLLTNVAAPRNLSGSTSSSLTPREPCSAHLDHAEPPEHPVGHSLAGLLSPEIPECLRLWFTATGTSNASRPNELRLVRRSEVRSSSDQPQRRMAFEYARGTVSVDVNDDLLPQAARPLSIASRERGFYIYEKSHHPKPLPETSSEQALSGGGKNYLSLRVGFSEGLHPTRRP